MSTPGHRVTITVRGYETDANRHLNHAVYHQYGEHGREETLRSAGVDITALSAAGIGPVILETTVRFLAELVVGDEVEVVTTTSFGSGKSFRMDTELVRVRDGATAATLTGVMGLLDHATRRLAADPHGRLRAVAADPDAFDRIVQSPG
ncbi:acyl-CoA thioesterase [Actinomycetospora termitidis]|uniref:Thioesterase family protein n=1 Tax=Actinomycetospora termitidis TaxID=3053470 RepID=A0ABT7MAK7_9PSEU|nr:thioesterase family protein [Actinomycetospora sp. Odt1-22]MDL5157699.1 thioesterase family protein [Actinomycetospora sp. Odt1-22]